LVGFVILGLSYLTGFARKAQPLMALVAVIAPAISCVITFMLFADMLSSSTNLVFTEHVFSWLSIADVNISVSLLGDRLSIYMSIFITFIGSLIHLYATGYMKEDEGFAKFFAYFHLFMASMLILVFADNPMIMFVGWEGVGLCSYLLISYYHTGADNVIAGNKAFILNRVGDFGFLLGIIFLYFAIGKDGFNFADLKQHINLIDASTLTIIGMLLFVGAMGKSAQIPLYTWLPDAMAGPTPVSALIHAATMVTAGVYMVARFGFLYDLIPNVGLLIAYIGAASALLAAIIATRQSDIKKILAYSTMSQLGYMFIAVGLGQYDAGLFHTFTHAFFKALLFLCAGSVLYALHHEQNIFNMGGLKKQMPTTFIFMGIGTLALAGIPPFAGFFSKDAIMMVAFAKGEYIIWVGTVVTAGLTAYYMSRLMTLAFLAPAKHEHHIHAPSFQMQGVLAVLAIGSILAGLIGIPEVLGGFNGVGHWLRLDETKHLELAHSTEYALMFISVIVALGSLYFGYVKFKDGAVEPTTGIVTHKFYVDELYDTLFVRSARALSSMLDRVMNHLILDGFVSGCVKILQQCGNIIAYTQNGNIRTYIFYMLVGSALIFTYLLLVL
jgi:NADH-quinone oxidoreductase subunit L